MAWNNGICLTMVIWIINGISKDHQRTIQPQSPPHNIGKFPKISHNQAGISLKSGKFFREMLIIVGESLKVLSSRRGSWVILQKLVSLSRWIFVLEMNPARLCGGCIQRCLARLSLVSI